MTNHLKLRVAYFSIRPRPLSLFLGLWVFFSGLFLALASAGVCASLLSGFLFWFFYLFFILKDFFVSGHVESVSWSTLASTRTSFFFNPGADIDSSAATDADDLVVFVADIFEFAEHEQALLLDSLTEVIAGSAFVCAGGASAALSVRALKAR